MKSRTLPLIVLLALLPSFALAQVNLPGIENTLTLSSSPESPGPNANVHLVVSDTFVDLATTNITWYVNTKQVSSGIGDTALDITLGDLGTETDITVTADTDLGQITATAAISPASVDLLWEADTYTPPFYLGRALPSAGSDIRVVAIPRFVQKDGSLVDPKTLLYTWKEDGVVIGTQSGVGKSSAVLGVSPLSHTAAISVDIKSPDGKFSGGATLAVPIVDPSFTLYEDHPLLGLLFDKALGANASISEQEMGFAAVPYFAPENSARDQSLIYTWQVNDHTIPSDTKNPNEITINAQNSKENASLSVTLSQLTNVFLDMQGAWNLFFSGAASKANIFTNPSGTQTQ